MPTRSLTAALLLVGGLIATGCRSKPPEVAVAPAPLDDSSAAALHWIDAHASAASTVDSGDAAARTALLGFVGNARIFGISELAEGAHEFPPLVRRIVHVLADGAGFRGLAVQAQMPEAMELDRYVRTGVGSARQWLRALGPHWDTQEVLDLVDWMRDYNRGRPSSDQIGFYGFEVPSATHAVQVVTSLPDSVAGAALKRWLTRELGCVAVGESAAWGRGGFASDSTFWNRCGIVAAAAADSLAALRSRLGSSPSSGSVALAEQMARLLQHYVTIGLRKLPRQETVAEHVLWLADNLGPSGKLIVWGRDVESGRLILGGTTVQSAVPVAARLGDRYRNAAFTIGEGVIRARPVSPGREPGDERNLRVRMPSSGSYEDILNRARLDAFVVDLRSLPSDTAGTWLRGPHPMRLISGVYTPDVPNAFETPIEFPAYYDGILFLRRVTPATPLKR